MSKARERYQLTGRISAHLYGLLLWLYPPALRRDHATEMRQAFRSTLRSEAERHGALGVVRTWCVMLTDLGLSSLRARWEARRRSKQRSDKRRGSHKTPDGTPHRGSAGLSHELMSDIRYALRRLVRDPLFTSVVLVTLGLGVGVNTAVFQAGNQLLIRPLPFADPDGLVALGTTRPSQGVAFSQVSAREVSDWRTDMSTFEDVAMLDEGTFSLSGDGDAEAVRGVSTSANLFSVLGVQPALGRTFVGEEGSLGADRVVVLSHGLWTRRFGADPDVLGRSLTVDGDDRTVIGVLPPTYEDPLPSVPPAGVYVPLALQPTPPWFYDHWLWGIARLADGASLEQASDELQAHRARMTAEYPEAYPQDPQEVGVAAISLHDAAWGELELLLYLGMAAAGFVLVIVCANLAGLLLARGASRGGERKYTPVDLPPGQTAGVDAGQALDASASQRRHGQAQDSADQSQRQALDQDLSDDLRSRGGDPHRYGRRSCAATSMLSAVLFGLIPALQLSRSDPQAFLKEGGGLGGGIQRRRLQRLMVISQMTASVILMVGAGLTFESFQKLASVETGFDQEDILTFELRLPSAGYARIAEVTAFHEELEASLAAIPSVTAVGAVDKRPLGTRWGCSAFMTSDRPQPINANDWPCGESRATTPDYLEVMGIQVIRGRPFSAADRFGEPPVVLVNQTLVDEFWPDADPIGQEIKWLSDYNDGLPWRRVVGVIEDVTHIGLDRAASPNIYAPFAQSPDRRMTVVLRSDAALDLLVPEVRARVASLDSTLPLRDLRSMEEIMEQALEDPLTAGLFLGLLAVAGLLLSLTGVYGVLANAVAQRRPEMGLRLALGAEAKTLVGGMVWQGLRMGLVAVVLGLMAAALLWRLAESLLFEVAAFDGSTFLLVGALLLAVATLASYLPARGAAKVDPLETLRYD